MEKEKSPMLSNNFVFYYTSVCLYLKSSGIICERNVRLFAILGVCAFIATVPLTPGPIG